MVLKNSKKLKLKKKGFVAESTLENKMEMVIFGEKLCP